MSTVSKILERKNDGVLSVSPDTIVFDTIQKMAERSAGTALVMEGEKLVGIVSERDFIRKVYLQNQCGKGVKVKDIMSTELSTVAPDETLENCMAAMTARRIRHLPVLEDGKVVGVISIGDIVKYMAEEKEFEIKNLQNYISGPGL